MRFDQALFDKVKSKNFLGNNAAHARVTVDPFWSLKETPPIYGSSFRGPYRYYTDNQQVEYEIPSIKSVSWNRSNSQDIARCTVTIYNTWHNLNEEEQELVDQLGKPGYFWPKRGQGDSSSIWNQRPGRGAYKRSGEWDPTFSWENVLVEDTIIRTFEGYGGKPTEGNYIPLQTNIDNNNLFLTGVWIVDSVTAGSGGLMVLECSDIGRILLDQIVFPPVIPSGLYPLEYYPPGQTAFNSPWGPRVFEGLTTDQYGKSVLTTPANKGEVWVRSSNSTGDDDSTVNSLAANVNNRHPSQHAVDGNWKTYAMSEAYATPDGGRPWFEFAIGSSDTIQAGINSLSLKTWGGGYTVYISIQEDSNLAEPGGTLLWKGAEDVPGYPGVKYVMKIEMPMYIPDGLEQPLEIELPDADNTSNEMEEYRRYANTFYPKKVRLTFENLSYSHIPDGTNRYRCGIRDLIFYRIGAAVNPYTADFTTVPWTFAMEQHPVRGYWVADFDGNVYGFGDAADFDSTGFGPINLGAYGQDNRIVGIAAHPSGEGYWVADWMGNVWGFGACDGVAGTTSSDPGGYALPDPWVAQFSRNVKPQCRGIAPTHTGLGFWLVYSNGIIRGFGDAAPSYAVIPATDLATFMDIFLRANYSPGQYVPYNIALKATAIGAHPKKMGFWVADGSGQVFAFGEAKQYGQLKNRVYNKGRADTFKLRNLEWATSIESTVSGEGYWIAFGSGRVAAFGDAASLGKTPYVYPVIVGEEPLPSNGNYDRELRGDYQYLTSPIRSADERNLLPVGDTEYITYPENDNIIAPPTEELDVSFFREILWSLARDPDGDGFWVLKASGDVVPYKADFWGKPGYTGLTGYRWHEGNFNGDWKDIVKEVLMWGGFTFYDPENPIADDEAPSVLGALESTGIVTDSIISAEKFDKQTLMDVIKELTQVVGYQFRISEEGTAIYSSPNWWRAGNFDMDGIPIYVNNAGERVDEDDPEAQPFIPAIDEIDNLLDYSVTLNTADKRSEIIIGTDLPDPKDPTRINYVRHTPPHALEKVSGNTPIMRNINRVALWVSQLFDNEEERKLMAELIGLHAWFASRVGSATIVGNPLLSIDDQVRIFERNTSERFIHLINSIDSSLDNDTGVYKMNLATNWLGSAADWVIATEEKDSDYAYVVISERLNNWQRRTGRGLEGGSGNIDYSSFNVDGKFTTLSSTVNTINEMIVIGDSMSYFDSTLDGLSNDSWPELLEDAGSVTTVYLGATPGATTQDLRDDPIVDPNEDPVDAVVIFLGANDQNTSLHGVTVEEYTENLQWFVDNYPATKQLIVFPWPWTGYPWTEPDPAPTEEEYAAYLAAATEVAADNDIAFLSLNDVVASIMANSGAENWDDYITDWIHPSKLGHELIANEVASKIHIAFEDDINWQFEGSIDCDSLTESLSVQFDIISNLGSSIMFELFNEDGDTVFLKEVFHQSQILRIPGNAINPNSTYTYRVSGIPKSKGVGRLSMRFFTDDNVSRTVTDDIIFVPNVNLDDSYGYELPDPDPGGGGGGGGDPEEPPPPEVTEGSFNFPIFWTDLDDMDDPY